MLDAFAWANQIGLDEGGGTVGNLAELIGTRGISKELWGTWWNFNHLGRASEELGGSWGNSVDLGTWGGSRELRGTGYNRVAWGDPILFARPSCKVCGTLV